VCECGKPRDKQRKFLIINIDCATCERWGEGGGGGGVSHSRLVCEFIAQRTLDMLAF